MSGRPVDVLAWLDSLHALEANGAITNRKWTEEQEARAAVAELIADANRWRAVTAVYAGFQARGDKMIAYISTPQWLGDWADFNDAIDRHFEINDAALANVGSAS